MKGWVPRVEGEIVIERSVEAELDFVADERNRAQGQRPDDWRTNGVAGAHRRREPPPGCDD